jgi:hypothetical protein
MPVRGEAENTFRIFVGKILGNITLKTEKAVEESHQENL